MNPKNRNLLIGGVIIALIIVIISPFIASSNPDGLESSAEHLNPQAMNNPGYWHAPFENYKIPFLGNGPLAGIAALVVGVLIVLGLAYGLTKLLKRRGNTEN
jgi:cobalt/nickel transport protein